MDQGAHLSSFSLIAMESYDLYTHLQCKSRALEKCVCGEEEGGGLAPTFGSSVTPHTEAC